jgi:hypothetical protein
MPTLDTVTVDEIFALFKGEAGTRKSTAALSFPTPQYWFSTDQKMDALILPGKNWGVNFKDINYDDYSDWNKVRAKLESLQVNCPYKTIVVDSITSNADVINRQTMKYKSGAKNKDGTSKGFNIGGIPVNTIDDYKAEASAFQELIALLKDIKSFHKVNVILIAHVIGARQPLDSKTPTHFARIIVTGGQIISAKIPAYCSEVYHFNIEKEMSESKEGQYGLLTVHTGSDFARTSLPLPQKILFNNDPLYGKYVKPAIDQMKNQPTTVKSF